MTNYWLLVIMVNLFHVGRYLADDPNRLPTRCESRLLFFKVSHKIYLSHLIFFNNLSL